MFLLIPLLLATPTVIWWMKEKQRIEMVCERQVLAAQEKLVDGMNSLIHLNPMVEMLVTQKKYLDLAVKTAPNPVVKAAFMAQLAVVIVKMKALRGRQLMIIKTQESLARMLISKIKPEVKTHLLRMHNQLEAVSQSHLTVSHSTPKIYLKPTFIDKMLPTYNATPLLPSQQSLYVLIRIKNFLFPQWLEFLKEQKSDWTESCSSKPHKGGLAWESFLGKVRPF